MLFTESAVTPRGGRSVTARELLCLSESWLQINKVDSASEPASNAYNINFI